jgi:hypothetical protein
MKKKETEINRISRIKKTGQPGRVGFFSLNPLYFFPLLLLTLISIDVKRDVDYLTSSKNRKPERVFCETAGRRAEG